MFNIRPPTRWLDIRHLEDNVLPPHVPAGRLPLDDPHVVRLSQKRDTPPHNLFTKQVMPLNFFPWNADSLQAVQLPLQSSLTTLPLLSLLTLSHLLQILLRQYPLR